MTPEQVLAHFPKVLTETQREAYFRDGYLLLERFVPDDWLATLRGLSERFIEERPAADRFPTTSSTWNPITAQLRPGSGA